MSMPKKEIWVKCANPADTDFFKAGWGAGAARFHSIGTKLRNCFMGNVFMRAEGPAVLQAQGNALGEEDKMKIMPAQRANSSP
jgi:hypothetical protein